MPGIADSPNSFQVQPSANAISQDVNITPAVGDFMKAFREGFITTEDITKRTLDKPLENAQRQQALQDVNTIRPKQRELAEKQLDIQSAQADTIKQIQPEMSEVEIGKAKEALDDFKKGGDPVAFKTAWRQFFPGIPLPRKGNEIDYEGGSDDIQVEIDRKKKLEAAKVGSQNIVENKVKRINPTSKKEEDVLIRTDKATGKVLGETVLSSQPATLTETEGASQRYAARLKFNQKILRETEAGGFDPAAIGTTVQKFVPNRFKSDEVQAYNAAKLNWIAAVLRKESGAAIAKKEYNDADFQYFPQDGDSPEVVKQKQSLRELAEQEMTKTIGPSAPDQNTTTPTPTTNSSGISSSETPVRVNTPAEAPPTAKFIQAPDGRVFKNPNYKP
jgi:hypothetical protein